MSQPAPQADAELRELIAAMCNGTATPAERDRLEQRLADDEDAQLEYLSFAEVHASFLWRHRGQTDDILALVAEGEGDDGRGLISDGTPQTAPEPPASPIIIDTSASLGAPLSAFPRAPVIVDLSSAGRYQFSPGSSFLGSWLMSYAAATVITGAMLLVLWTWKVSQQQELAGPSPTSTQGTERREKAMESVGRITGMVDCRWMDPQPPLIAASVPLGGKFSLGSGLMEITYDTGAKVILEGPCTYEVDSRDGGFLSLGKLTARVETKGEGGRGKAEGASKQESSFPLPPSPFVVKTPTAVVTDLGTEFGVEVRQDGATASHVFLGRVSLAAVGAGGEKRGREVLLEVEQSARVEKAAEGGEPTVTVDRGRSKPEGFVRALPLRSGAGPENLPPLPVVRGLALWLAADVGVIRDEQSRVHVWRGLPVGDNHRAEDARQALDRHRPKWIADAIHGRPAVRFDGEATFLTTEPFQTTAEQTCFVVFAPHEQHVDLRDRESLHQLFNSNSPRRVVLQIDGRGALLGKVYSQGHQGGNPLPPSTGVVASGPLPLHQPALATYRYARRAGAYKGELRLDGRRLGAAPAAGPADAVSPMWIGCHPEEFRFFAGDIAELLIYDADLSADEIARVEAYLGAKYGISTNPPSIKTETPQKEAPQERVGFSSCVNCSVLCWSFSFTTFSRRACYESL